MRSEQAALLGQKHKTKARQPAAQGARGQRDGGAVELLADENPTNAPLKVEMKPCSDAAIPAIAPIGSIAMAPKLDTDKLKVAMVNRLQHHEGPDLLESQDRERGHAAP